MNLESSKVSAMAKTQIQLFPYQNGPLEERVLHSLEI